MNLGNDTVKNKSGKTAAIIGATGMIGKYLQEALYKDERFDTVRLIVRRPMEKPHPKAEVKLVDFNDAESVKLALEDVNIVFSCIGTTQKNVKGDKALYRRIDLEIPERVAKYAYEAGAEAFAMVSSVGADASSRNFYLRLKGEAENAVIASSIPSIHIMRPSMLLGHRDEQRPGEGFLQSATKAVSGLLFGSWKKYRAIHGRTVAQAMINAALSGKQGVHWYHWEEMEGNV
ncbi:NAD(P)H-binding protein [Terrimonas ferruginea]|uniref:NAD(P)H-binding protein n=1 Tax=Terrimonas ferruginea TaxID=249 RepID=UPI00041358AC|nr:NAD(P)H-binding protein [Terrimonas ferruginea]